MKNIYKIAIVSAILFGSSIPAISNAQLNPTEDPNNSAFKLIYCDGPKLPPAVQTVWNTENPGKTYIVCDFAGAMGQVQHLINIMTFIMP